MSGLGIEVSPPVTPAEAKQFPVTEQARWKPVVEQAGVVQN